MAADRPLVVQQIAYAALDALRATVALDLCAYLHVVDDGGPQLYLRAPELASMSATQAFDVFTSLRDAVGSVESDGPTPCAVGRYDALAIRTAGARSSGVFVVGREDGPLPEHEQALVAGICGALGAAAHLVEEQAPLPAGPAVHRVAVSVGDGRVGAEVVAGPGSGRIGRAEATTTSDAVALATLDALAPDHKLVAVADVDIAGERAAVVLVRTPDDRSALGAAMAGGDVVLAVASAAAEAVARSSMS